MPTKIADMYLIPELERLRRSLPTRSGGVLMSSQAFTMSEIAGPQDAVEHLLAQAMRLVRLLPLDTLHPLHPAVAALATIMHHPLANPMFYELLPTAHRPTVSAMVEARGGRWSPERLQWQWAQFVATFEDVEMHPDVTLPMQVFDSRPLNIAWSALMDLETLRGWGLVT